MQRAGSRVDTAPLCLVLSAAMTLFALSPRTCTPCGVADPRPARRVAAGKLRLLAVDVVFAAADALSEVATHGWQALAADAVPDDTQTAWGSVPPAMLAADASVTTTVLSWIDTEHRSVEDLLEAHGLRSTSVAQLRHHLLDGGDRPR